MNKYISAVVDRLPLIAILAFVFGILLNAARLSISVPFHNWDEAIYATLAKEFLSAPNIYATFNGLPWLEKPHLIFALIAQLWRVFGVSEFIARIPGTFASIIMLFAIWRICARLQIERLYAALAITSTTATIYFLDRASILNVDIYLTLFWCLYFCSDKTRFKFISTFFAVSAKSLLGFVPLVADFIADVYTKNLSAKKICQYAAIAILSLWWHILMYVKFGDKFMREHFIDHLVSRVTKPIELHFGGKFFYVDTLYQNYFWYIVIVAFAVAFIAYKSLSTKDRYPLSILTCITIYFILITISRAKLHWYTLPLIPFLSIFTAYFFANINFKYKNAVVICLTLYFLATTIKKTALTNYKKFTPSPGVRLARCANSNFKYSQVDYLVDLAERQNLNTLEAAKLNIGSSGRYGGDPGFVFYNRAQVRFYYDKLEFLRKIGTFKFFVYSASDRLDIEQRLKQPDFASNSKQVVSFGQCVEGDKTFIAVYKKLIPQ